MPTIRRRSRTATAVLGVALAGVFVVAPGADAAATRTVTMTSSNMFMPMSMTITRGTVVTWKNNSFSSHNVTANSGAWASGTIKPGGTYTRTFKRAGTVRYHCTIHPGMTAMIVVK